MIDLTGLHQMPISELRPSLAKLRPWIKLGKTRIAVTCYGQTIGYLTSIASIQSIQNAASLEIPLKQLRDEIHTVRDSLIMGTDLVILTFHRKPELAFVHWKHAKNLLEMTK